MKRFMILLFVAACSGTPEPPPLSEAELRDQAVQGMHDKLLADVEALVLAAKDIQAAAPLPPSSGWGPSDAAAIKTMQDAWVRARTAYEHIEGGLAPLFPDIDYAIDARYDDFLTDLAPAGDTNLFDDQGVTGMHAIERILFLPTTPQRVVDFEKVLPGYTAATQPATAQEAADFKNKLCAKLVADAIILQQEWTPAKIKAPIAFQGLISLMNEQREKVVKASSNEEESRYAQRTMADLRDNLAGTKTAYAQFKPWLLTRKSQNPLEDGKTIDEKITKGFADLDAAYALVSGDAIPEPPATWSAETPTAADLATPFGKLYTSVKGAVDPNVEGSIVGQMNAAAAILGFPIFKPGQ